MVWSRPMIKVAETLGVSGSYLARVCSALSVPRPERGYWAKLAVGNAPAVQPLPDPQAGCLLEWSKGAVLPPLALVRPIQSEPIRRQKRSTVVSGAHPLIREARHHFENGRPVDEHAYLKPFKYLLVDLTTSAASLDRGLKLANDLFNALETAGYPVTLASPGQRWSRGHVDPRAVQTPKQNDYYPTLWCPSRPTVVHVGADLVGLALIEISESIVLRYVNGKYVRDADYVAPKRSRYFVDHSWTTTKDLPSGRFRLIAFAPNWRIAWSEQWDEKKGDSLNTRIPAIVKAMKEIAREVAERQREAERQWALELAERDASFERYKRKDDKERIAKSVKESREQLDKIIAAWGEVRNLELFFQGVEASTHALPDDERQRVLSRLALARGFVGTQDPMEFFLDWMTPSERYRPRYDEDGAEVPTSRDEGQ
jgi:hypothetical protein